MAWVEKRGTTWRVRYWKSDGGAGSIGGFTTQQSAQDYAQAMDSGQTHAPGVQPPRQPPPPAPPVPSREGKELVLLGEWAERWWQTIDVSDSTEAFYRSLLTRHLLPTWGATPLEAIAPSAVKTWLGTLRATYAPATIKSLRKLFAILMADAVDEGLITTNPIRPERRGRGRLEPHVERAWIDEHQLLVLAQRILRLSSRNQCLLVITAAYTGMRWGELAGLHRNNVDLTRSRIDITATGALHEVNGTLTLGHPKTHSSVRTVTLPPFLTELIKIDLASHQRPFVFTTLRGKHLRRSGYQRRTWAPSARGGQHLGEYWTPVNERLTFHGLRHSHKTWLIEDGVPDIAQARRLGHAAQNKMDGTYGHVTAAVEARLLAALQARWERSITALPRHHQGGGPLPLAS